MTAKKKGKKRRYWLVKSEPDVFSFDDLMALGDGAEHWDGVRNYQARNMMRDDMKIGDRVLFYHSNTKPPHVAGIAEVVREGYPDHTSWDPDSNYFDPKSTPEEPRWFMVDLHGLKPLERTVSLKELKANDDLADMKVVQRGQRLSVQPVEEDEYFEVLRMADTSDAD